ncbi:Fimbrillin-like [Prevotellaceae bacterium HUN156]|nr:Fimbrillin-like [Prevotellaceae bacterium HUN156]
MKKMVFMAAFVAATAAFVACSSNDDLVQQKPEVPEEMVDEGTPMKIIVSDLATRGTDFSSTNPLTKFKLYSSLDSYWTAGKLMEYKNDAWTTNNSLTWDDEDEHTFFAINVEEDDEFADIAENAGAGDDHPDLPVVTATTCSFNYKMPQSLKPNSTDEYWCDSENLKDLLVAKSIGGAKYEPVYNDPVNGETKYEAGSLFVNFQHALAQITGIKIYANEQRLVNKGFEDCVLYLFRINGIRLCGLKSVGTYTFDAPTPWAVSGDDTEFTIPLTELTYAKTTFRPGTLDDGISLTLTDGGLYLIPQVADGSIASDGSGGYQVNGAYAELDAQVFVFNSAAKTTLDDDGWYHCSESDAPLYFDEDNSNDAGWGKVRLPLKFSLDPGKGYTLVLDLSRGIIWEAAFTEHQPVFDGVSFDTN